VLPAREGGEFRGSTTYASVHSHLKQDLGARPQPGTEEALADGYW